MKTTAKTFTSFLAVFSATLVFSVTADAGISGTNIPFNTNATIRFGDNLSFNGGSPGISYSPPVANPWNGTLYSTPLYSDPTTLDSAQGSIEATFTPSTYALNVPLAFLSQAVGNTGSALLQYLCVVEFQTDAAGLPTMPTLFPTFSINGTVQPGGFADLTGSITYTSGAGGLVDTVNYLYNNVTPGAFTATVSGVAGIGTTPTLPAFDTLTLIANFSFTVDPATISATTVPEPSSAMLALLSLPLLLRRRRS